MHRAIAISLSFVALASAAASAASKTESQLQSVLAERFPQIKIEQVRPAPWAGMYEVVTATELAYTNADGSLLFAGHVLDTKTKEDLTQQRWNALNAIEFEKLPFDLAIKTVRGNGERKLAVFADPECPFCQKLENELKGVDNVTIYTFLFPLDAIHPNARAKAIQIWCAEDRAATWSAWMTEQKAPAQHSCENPVQQTVELGEQLKITSTPTLFFVDGHRFNGYMEHQQLEGELNNTAKLAKK